MPSSRSVPQYPQAGRRQLRTGGQRERRPDPRHVAILNGTVYVHASSPPLPGESTAAVETPADRRRVVVVNGELT
jgi:hypothetical protein